MVKKKILFFLIIAGALASMVYGCGKKEKAGQGAGEEAVETEQGTQTVMETGESEAEPGPPGAAIPFQFVKGYGIVTSQEPVYILDAKAAPELTQGDVTITLDFAVQQNQTMVAHFKILDRSEIERVEKGEAPPSDKKLYKLSDGTKISSQKYREDIWAAGDGIKLMGPDIPEEGFKPIESQYYSDPDFYEKYGFMRYFIAASFDVSSFPDLKNSLSGYSFRILEIEQPIEFSMKPAPGYETLEALAAEEGTMDTHDGFSILAVRESVDEGILIDWYTYSDTGDRMASVAYNPPFQKGDEPVLSSGNKVYASEQDHPYKDMFGLYRLAGTNPGGQHLVQMFVVPEEERDQAFTLTVSGPVFLSSELSDPITLAIPEDSEELSQVMHFREGQVRISKITKLEEPQQYRETDRQGAVKISKKPVVYIEVWAFSETKDLSLRRLSCERKTKEEENQWEYQRYNYGDNEQLNGFYVFYEEGDTDITLRFGTPGFYWNQPYEFELGPV